METKRPNARCYCGSVIGLEVPAASGVELEVACSCGRRLAFESLNWSWIYRGSVKRSAPPAREAGTGPRSLLDVERYSFDVTERGFRRVSVDIVFSPSQRVAEVGHADARPLLLTGIMTPTQARRKWLELRRRDWMSSDPAAARASELAGDVPS